MYWQGTPTQLWNKFEFVKHYSFSYKIKCFFTLSSKQECLKLTLAKQNNLNTTMNGIKKYKMKEKKA